jgi:hypothetical protein
MTDVTFLFSHYRVAARAIWNTAFWPDAEYRHWDASDQFDEIRRLLFDALVLDRLGKRWDLRRILREPIPFFHVVPASGESVPVMISNPREGRNCYWDDPVNRIRREDATLCFIDHFDWNRMDYIDLQYYRVRIADFPGQPHLVGRDALLEVRNANVLLVDAETPSDS